MTPYERLDAWIDAHFDEEVRFLQAVVRVPTPTPPGDNAPPISVSELAGAVKRAPRRPRSAPWRCPAHTASACSTRCCASSGPRRSPRCAG